MSAAVGLTLGFSTDLPGFPRLEPPWFGNGTWHSTDRAWWHNTLHEAGIAQADFIAPVTRSENPRGEQQPRVVKSIAFDAPRGRRESRRRRRTGASD